MTYCRWLLPFLLLTLGVAQAQPKPDAQGNYLRNDGPRQATAPRGSLAAGSLWRVLAPHLNGRAQARLDAPVVRVFARDTILQADLGRGGSDEVLFNAIDAQGHTWMRVRPREGQDLNCYVRAHRKLIAPLP